MYIFSLNRDTENLKRLIYPVKLQYIEFFKYTPDISRNYKLTSNNPSIPQGMRTDLNIAIDTGNFELMKLVINAGGKFFTKQNIYIMNNNLRILQFLYENNAVILTCKYDYTQVSKINIIWEEWEISKYPTILNTVAAYYGRYYPNTSMIEWLLDIEENESYQVEELTSQLEKDITREQHYNRNCDKLQKILHRLKCR